MRKKILYFDNSLDGVVGGSHHSLLLLVKNLDPEKYEKVVVLNSDMALRTEFDECSKVIIWKGLSACHFAGLGERRGWSSKFNFLPKPVARPANFLYKNTMIFYNDLLRGAGIVKDCVSLLRKEKVQLAHLNNSFEPYWISAAKLCGVPVVQHVRGFSGGVYAPFCHLTAKVVCISNDVKSKMLEMGINPTKIVRIYNAVDCASFRPTRSASVMRAQLGLSPTEHVVALFGNIQRWKGQETLVKACAQLKKKQKNVRCVLFGAIIEEDYARELKQIAETEEVTDSFIYAGYTGEVANWMNAADIIVHASVEEPFGRVLIEAMSLGKPVIGASSGAVPEIIEHKVNGLLFEPGNHGQLADHIDFLLSHPDMAERFGVNGSRRARLLFDVHQHVQEIEKLYDEVLNRT
jgi:glycosyltransferase involved in cell wall biosynthesis